MTEKGCCGRQMKMKRKWQFLTLLVGLACASVPTQADDMAIGVKAAFLYNFTKFIQWPDKAFARTDSQLVVCVSAPLQSANIIGKTVQGKTTQGRAIDYRYVTEKSALNGCHLWFVSSDTLERSSHWHTDLRTQPLVVVGEGEDFIEEFGTIGLLIVDGRIRFAINERRAIDSGLHISSKLLSLAQRVVR